MNSLCCVSTATSTTWCTPCCRSWGNWLISSSANSLGAERKGNRPILRRSWAACSGVDDLGRRQLNELLANTPYHQRQRQYFMDRRIGQSTVARQRFTTSAPAQERRPPAPPSVPVARRGRSSDERASPRTATERNRTLSPVGRNRPTETSIRTPPRRVQRDPSSYISDADWSAMRSGRSQLRKRMLMLQMTQSALHRGVLLCPILLALLPRGPNAIVVGKPADPVTFGYFFSTHGVSEWERRARQVTVDFFEELEASGQLYPNFRLGCDQAGQLTRLSPADRNGHVQTTINGPCLQLSQRRFCALSTSSTCSHHMETFTVS